MTDSGSESVEEEKKSFLLWLILVPAALAVMCLGAAVTGLLLYMFKA